MPKSTVTLNDKFDLSISHQLLTGSQAIARLLLMQKARDKQHGASKDAKALEEVKGGSLPK